MWQERCGGHLYHRHCDVIAADPAGDAVAIPNASIAVTILGQPGGGAAIQRGGIVNSASWISGPVSAGEVVTLLGSGIGPAQPATLQILPSGLVSTNLSDTLLSFGSTQAPLIYAGQSQINAVVPFEVAGLVQHPSYHHAKRASCWINYSSGHRDGACPVYLKCGWRGAGCRAQSGWFFEYRVEPGRGRLPSHRAGWFGLCPSDTP